MVGSLQSGDVEDDSPLAAQANVADAITANFYGGNLKLPFSKAAFAEGQALLAQRLDSAGFTNGNRTDAAAQKSPEQVRKQMEDEALELAALIAEEGQREMERKEWARASSTIGGVTLNNADWGLLADRLRSDEDLRRRILDAFRARGMSDDEARARLDRATHVADAVAVPPNQRSDAQKNVIADAEGDPTFQRDMHDIQKYSSMDASGDLTAKKSFSQAVAGNTTAASQGAPAAAPVVAVDGPGF